MPALEPTEVALRRLVGVDADHVELRRRAIEIVRPRVGFDFAVWATVDPTTLMWTHCLFDGGDRDPLLEAAIFRNEYQEEDVLKLVDLTTAPAHVGTLHDVTGGEPSRSRRYVETLEPMGFRDELRLLFTDGEDAWGALCLFRSDRPFARDEVDDLAGAGPAFGSSLRGSLLRTAVAAHGPLDAPPGLVLCSPDGAMLHVSEEAHALLDAVDPADAPAAVAAVVVGRATGGRAAATVPSRDGGWIALHATTAGGQAAVVVERLRSHRLADLIVRLRGLTARERDVVGCVARGLSTRATSEALFISEYTVQDHLKSVFAKFDVGSRAELVASLFFDHYEPRHSVGDDPSPYGWFLDR